MNTFPWLRKCSILELYTWLISHGLASFLCSRNFHAQGDHFVALVVQINWYISVDHAQWEVTPQWHELMEISWNIKGEKSIKSKHYNICWCDVTRAYSWYSSGQMYNFLGVENWKQSIACSQNKNYRHNLTGKSIQQGPLFYE